MDRCCWRQLLIFAAVWADPCEKAGMNHGMKHRMKTPIETLFADCRGHFLARRMADAFPLAHQLVQRLGNERSMALLDSLKIMAECCDDAGQPFFAAEIYRHTHSLDPRASFSVQLPDIDDPSLVAK
jgi:hypothetical protein